MTLKLRRRNGDLLNESHTLGLGALSAFEKAADDLEEAASLAFMHAFTVADQIDLLEQERDAAHLAEQRYGRAAERVRDLVGS